jgi:hypothetical protein
MGKTKSSNKSKQTTVKKSRKQSKKTIKKRMRKKEVKKTGSVTKGVEPHKVKWNEFNFWDTVFHPYHIQHMYMYKKLMFAELVIYKEPINDIRGYIEFYIDGPVTINKVDGDTPNSVHRMVVGVGDKIIFRVDHGKSKLVTKIEFIPKYQQDMKKNKSGLYKGKLDFGYVSKDRINDIKDVFSWLEYTDEPKYFEDILKKIVIEKGVHIKDKELPYSEDD